MKPTSSRNRAFLGFVPCVLRTMGLGVAMLAAAESCFAQVGPQTSPTPEQLPPPVVMQAPAGQAIVHGEIGSGAAIGTAVPYIAPQPLGARDYPLWQSYEGDKGHHGHATTACACQTCKPKKSRPVKKLLGKLTHGLDVVLFGTCASSHDCDSCGNCDSGCDAACDSMCVTNDGACDAIGPSAIGIGAIGSGGLHSNAKHHAAFDGMNAPNSPAPNSNRSVTQPAPSSPPVHNHLKQLPVNKQVPTRQIIPEQPKEMVRPKQQDPFIDDPITVTGRATIKPATLRR